MIHGPDPQPADQPGDAEHEDDEPEHENGEHEGEPGEGEAA
jgi:hypothetical protein